MHLAHHEKERIRLALLLSLALHLLFFLGTLLLPGARSVPKRLVSPPIEVSFELPRPPEPPPAQLPTPPVPAQTVPSRPTPPAPSHPQPTPAPAPRQSTSPSSSSPENFLPDTPVWNPEPAPDFQEDFTAGGKTAAGGRIATSERSDSRADLNTTAREKGFEEGDAPVTARSNQETPQSSGPSRQELSLLDEVLAKGQTPPDGSSGTGGADAPAARVTVGDISNLERAFSVRGAEYGGLPPLSPAAAREITAKALPEVRVRVTFTISPMGAIDGLQTDASPGYPALDAFLRANLPRVLRFESLPERYAGLRQEVSVELSVKSN